MGESREEIAKRLAERVRVEVPVPYPAREAVDPVDAALLGAAELFDDPRWLADVWLADGDQAGGVAR